MGDVSELGVYKGNTCIFVGGLRKTHTGKTAYLLDTFSGFSADDISGIDRDKSTGFADTSLSAVKKFVGRDNVIFVEGKFPELASKMPDGLKVSLVHIDCDLFAPMLAALEYFYPRLMPGCFLVLHDYASLVWNGTEKAIDQFIADKCEKLVPIPDKSGTAVLRKMSPRS